MKSEPFGPSYEIRLLINLNHYITQFFCVTIDLGYICNGIIICYLSAAFLKNTFVQRLILLQNPIENYCQYTNMVSQLTLVIRLSPVRGSSGDIFSWNSGFLVGSIYM